MNSELKKNLRKKMKMKEEGIVKVGSKPKSDYISAVMFCLDRFGEAKLQGLGNRQGKVLEIAESVSKVNGVEIRAINGIQVEDMGGLEVIIERVGSGESE